MQPEASTTVDPAASIVGSMAAISPSRMPMSARRAALPVPSTTSPPRITTSKDCVMDLPRNGVGRARRPDDIPSPSPADALLDESGHLIDAEAQQPRQNLLGI